MTGRMRWAYWATAWLFIGSVLLQVFLAGLALFAGISFELHGVYGGTAVHLISLVLIALAIAARAGRRTIRQPVLLFVLVTIQVSLPALREAVPLVAALHPMNALLIFWLGLRIARQADVLRRVPLATHVPAATEIAPAQL